MRHRSLRHSILLAVAAVFLVTGITGEALSQPKAEAPPLGAMSPTKVVAHSLLQFESAVRWRDVHRNWKKIRGKWIAAVRNADTPAKLGTLTLALEAHMGWPSVHPRWRKVRPGWARKANNPGTVSVAAKLLLTLEAHTKWSAVYKWWGKKRKPWIKRLKTAM